MSVGGTNPEGDKKKKAAIVIICLVAVVASLLFIGNGLRSQSAAVTAARSAPGGGAPGGGGSPGGRQMPGTRGQITAVSGSAITIQGRGGDAKTFTLTAATQITVDQKPVAAMELKVGQRARVVSTDNKSATEVHIRTRPFGGRGGRGSYPGGGAPAAVGIS